MFSEEFILKLFTFPLEYKIRCLGIYGVVRPLQICNGITALVAMSTNVFYYSSHFEASISGFVSCMLFLTFWLLLLALIVTEFNNGDAAAIYETISEVGTKTNPAIPKQNDQTLLQLASMHLLVVAVSIFDLFVDEFHWSELTYVVKVIVLFRLLSAVMEKHLVAKRLKYLRTAEEFMESIEYTISGTRQLLDCNARINRTYGLVATTFALFMFKRVLFYSYSVWLFYGLNFKFYDSSEKFLLDVMNCCTMLMVFLLLATFSSRVVDEIDQIVLELDITLTARGCSKKQERLIFTFLMELHHTPVELSALGLFNINRFSVSSACTVIVSYLLVLIQYA